MGRFSSAVGDGSRSPSLSPRRLSLRASDDKPAFAAPPVFRSRKVETDESSQSQHGLTSLRTQPNSTKGKTAVSLAGASPKSGLSLEDLNVSSDTKQKDLSHWLDQHTAKSRTPVAEPPKQWTGATW